jgi:hypothetical protein
VTFTRMIPFLILGIVALLLLGLVFWQLRRSRDVEIQQRLAAEKRWPGYCQFDNPNTGAKCTREEFHLENHYHDLGDGRLSRW